MTTDHPDATTVSAGRALEHLAVALELQQDEASQSARSRLAEEMRDATRAEGTGGARAAHAVLATNPQIAELVVRAPEGEVAAVLDALASPGSPPATRDEDGHHHEDDHAQPLHAPDGPIAAWGYELRRLTRRSSRKAADYALAKIRHGYFEPPPDRQAPAALDNPLLAESTVDLLGGRWVEGSYRSLYRAARREWTRRDDVERVVRGVSGLTPVNSPTPEFAAGQLQVPAHALPVVRGRDAVIERVASALDAPDRRVQVLVGRAGYGKSTVALALADRARTQGRLALWVPAPDRDSLAEGLELAAVRVGSTVREVEAARAAPYAEQVARLWALLDDSPRPWLVVLDDAGDEAVGNPDWVHNGAVGAVVITSRSGADGWGPRADVTQIGELDPGDGALVVLDRLDERAQAGGIAMARELSRHLGGMPLALASAGRLAAANVGGPSLAELVDRLRAAAALGPLPAVYEVGLQTSPDQARTLLRLLACFAPDEPLPQRLVGHTANLAVLVEAGLLEELPRHGQRCVRLHPAIAEQSRRDDSVDADLVKGLTEKAVDLLCRELSRLDAGLAADWPSICQLEPHVAALVESPAADGDDLLSALLELADHTAEALVRAGRQTAAAALLDRALDVTKALGEPHPARLAARRTLAWMMAFDRDLRTAELLLQTLVDDCIRWLGAEHPHTLAARDCAAWLRFERGGAVDESRAELGRILVARRRLLGDRHPATLATWHRLAWISALCRREEWAAEQLGRILTIRLTMYSPEHLDVFSTRYRLAWLLVRRDELARAEREFRALHDDLRRVVGERHPLTLMVRSRIAWVLKRRRRFTAAQRAYTAVLGDQVDVLGHGHPRVLRTRHLLACLELHLGRSAEAVRTLRTVVEDRETVLGPDHYDTLISRSYLAWALFQAGDAAAADREFSAVLADRMRLYGPRHRLTLMTRGLQGRVHVKRGMLHDAERRLARLLVEEINLLGPDDRLVFETRHALGVVAGHLGHLDDCEAGLRSVLADRTAVLGPDDPDTLAAKDYLAWALTLQGKLDEATSVCSAVLADRERILGARHPHTLNSRYHAAWITGQQGRWATSHQLAEDLLRDLRAALGERHPHTLRCRSWIVRALRFTGRLEEAEREAREVVLAQSRVQGAAAVDTLRAREELSLVLLARGQPATAAEALAALLRDRREALGDRHPDTIRCLALWEQARTTT